MAYTERLDDLGIDPSVGSKGDAYDNAMAEAWVATYKTELVHGRRFPSFEHAEHETLAWIGFYNDDRLHENLGDIPPAECEDDYFRLNLQGRQQQDPHNLKTEPPGNPGRISRPRAAPRPCPCLELEHLTLLDHDRTSPIEQR